MTKLSFSKMLGLATRVPARLSKLYARRPDLVSRQGGLATLPPNDLINVARRVAGLSYNPPRRLTGLATPVPGELFR